MKIKKMTGYAFFELIEDRPSDMPTVYKTEKDCIDSNRSYFGMPCDDPRKRGVIAKVDLTFRIPEQVKMNQDIWEYVHCNGGPALLVAGDREWNAHIFKEAAERKRRTIRKAKKLLPRDK